ncbi:MAG: hypothetical protein SGJ04_04125 [Bacteroidota bacterium]|nr:hypothetical protein [Bacteroidota bacterium]
MHSIEPYFKWRPYYTSETDRNSPFYKRKYSEFYFSNSIYDHYIHPQWDEFGSNTLYIKLLFVDYDDQYAIIEMIGEWNDCINNDIMFLKRNVIDELTEVGINKFIMIGENVLNFHFDIDDYYDEWFQDVEDGWIAAINFQEHILQDFSQYHLDYYLNFGGKLDSIIWRTQSPSDLFNHVSDIMNKRLN